MASGRTSALAGFVDDRLSAGAHYFTSKEAEEFICMGRGAFLDSAELLLLRNVLVTPRQGFYLIIVDPRDQVRGAPSATEYVDALMRHAGADYYVSLLTAAIFHGASRLAVQEFQVVCGKQQKPVSAGRTRFEFFYRSDMDSVSGAVESRTFHHDGSSMLLSGPELTALDLLRYRKGFGSVNFVSNVLAELAPKVCPDKLADLSVQFDKPVLQRLGYHLEFLQYWDHAKVLQSALEMRGPLQWINLDRLFTYNPYFSPGPLELNGRWCVEVGEHPEPDV